MTVTDIVPQSPKGRPRDPALDEAIFDATLAMFAEGGYRNVSIEGVAARAGVGKATIYRRHPTKAALGDITGDGKADVVAVESQGGGQYRYMLGKSSGTGISSWSSILTNMAYA